MADAGATATASGDVAADIIEEADNEGYRRIHWAARSRDTCFVSDLNRGLLKHLPSETYGGYTNDPESTARWREAAPELSARFSNAYLTTHRMGHWLTKQVLYARYGYLYNARLKQLYGRGGDGKCPLCRHGQEGPTTDSGSHILGGCRHKTMVGAYINRHNSAVRAVAACLHNGSKGGGLMIMDAGKAEELPEYCAGNRPPPWMFTETDRRDPNVSKMRPDIMFIPNLPGNRIPRNATTCRLPGPKNQYPVYIIEVGYTSDLNHTDKCTEKTIQHKKLSEALERAGWTVHYTRNEVITLGATGTIPNTVKPLLQTLGASAEQANKCCLHLHQHAVVSAGAIIKNRRMLENGLQQGARGVG